MSGDCEATILGVPYAIGEAICGALAVEFERQGVQVFGNPLRRSDLDKGERVVFFEDMADRPLDQAGNQQKRTFGFNLGVINRTTRARRGAHEDYRAAKRVVIEALKTLQPIAAVTGSLREGEVIFRVENIDVGGALVLGTFSVNYRDPV